MIEALQLVCVPASWAMIWMASRALLRAEKLHRCARPFVMPILAGVGSAVLMALSFIDRSNGIKLTHDVLFGMLLINLALMVAVILLIIPHLQKRRNGIR